MDTILRSEPECAADRALRARVEEMLQIEKMKEILSSDEKFFALNLDNIIKQVNPNTPEGQEMLNKVTDALTELKKANKLSGEEVNKTLTDYGFKIESNTQRITDVEIKLKDFTELTNSNDENIKKVMSNLQKQNITINSLVKDLDKNKDIDN